MWKVLTLDYEISNEKLVRRSLSGLHKAETHVEPIDWRLEGCAWPVVYYDNNQVKPFKGDIQRNENLIKEWEGFF